MSTLETHPPRASREFAIGGDLPIVRLGYSSMQITDPRGTATRTPTSWEAQP
jgi:hypothetical protein